MKTISKKLEGPYGLTALYYKEDGYFVFLYNIGDGFVHVTNGGTSLAGYGETLEEALAALEEVCLFCERKGEE